MMRYGTPIMAGIAFAINEQFDKIFCQKLPADIAEAEVGVYSVISWVCSWFCIEQPIL
jgi:hypothetical protein